MHSVFSKHRISTSARFIHCFQRLVQTLETVHGQTRPSHIVQTSCSSPLAPIHALRRCMWTCRSKISNGVTAGQPLLTPILWMETGWTLEIPFPTFGSVLRGMVCYSNPVIPWHPLNYDSNWISV